MKGICLGFKSHWKQICEEYNIIMLCKVNRCKIFFKYTNDK